MKTKIEEAIFCCIGCVVYIGTNNECIKMFEEHNVDFCDNIIFVEDIDDDTD